MNQFSNQGIISTCIYKYSVQINSNSSSNSSSSSNSGGGVWREAESQCWSDPGPSRGWFLVPDGFTLFSLFSSLLLFFFGLALYSIQGIYRVLESRTADRRICVSGKRLHLIQVVPFDWCLLWLNPKGRQPRTFTLYLRTRTSVYYSSVLNGNEKWRSRQHCTAGLKAWRSTAGTQCLSRHGARARWEWMHKNEDKNNTGSFHNMAERNAIIRALTMENPGNQGIVGWMHTRLILTCLPHVQFSSWLALGYFPTFFGVCLLLTLHFIWNWGDVYTRMPRWSNQSNSIWSHSQNN